MAEYGPLKPSVIGSIPIQRTTCPHPCRPGRSVSLENVMRSSTKGFMLTAMLAACTLFVDTTSAGIADTKHNLSSGAGIVGRNQVSNTEEICVFCHTPHGGDSTAQAPLWNKKIGANGTPAGGGSFTTYDALQTPSLDGTVAQVGSVSIVCLSCHDGTAAMDNVINAPGSGNHLSDGGGPDGRAYQWTGSTVDASGRLSGGVALIGTDLSNDHPIGIQFCGGGLSGSGTTVTGTCKDSDFKTPETTVINGKQVFWVETGGAGKQRTDLPLYQRTTGNLGPMVECASCHDPHVSSAQAGPPSTGRVAGETFLRISNKGSALCVTCHTK
jgi:hypothetical protein